MKPLAILTCAFFSMASFCYAQTPVKTNAISLELGKTGLIYNLSFDHKAANKNLGYRLAAGTNVGRYLKAASAGGGAYCLFGNADRFFELGIDLRYLMIEEISDDQKGIPLIYPDHNLKTFYPSIDLGYRATGKWTLFRIGFSPGIISNNVVPGGYLGYGIRF